MKLRKSMLALVVASTLAAGGAHSAPYTGNFNTGAAFDGWLTGVTGVDIFSNGAAAFFCQTAAGCGGGTVAFGAQLDPAATTALGVGDLISTVYQGVVNVVNPGVTTPHMVFPGSGSPTEQYQLTVAATFTEVVIGGFFGPGFATALLQPVDGGRVSLFYDNNSGTLSGTLIDTAAVLSGAGIGYTDGLLVADGTVSSLLSLPTNVSADGTRASGSANIAGLFGFVRAGTTSPDEVGFDPAPHDFESTTTLQYGPTTGGYQVGNFFDNANGWTSVAVNAALTERADANVDFTAVPEPGILALFGIGCLAGLGVRRRNRAV